MDDWCALLPNHQHVPLGKLADAQMLVLDDDDRQMDEFDNDENDEGPALG